MHSSNIKISLLFPIYIILQVLKKRNRKEKKARKNTAFIHVQKCSKQSEIK